MESIVEEVGSEYVEKLYKELPKGKRLRAKLVLKVADNSEEAVKLAAIIELIHAASLLHDDVIDDADMRRGVASINAVYGDKSAIMLGDILYSKAYFKLVEFKEDIAKIISNAVALLSLGELNDVRLSQNFSPDEDEYFEMIYQKTASLIEASAKSAAVLSGLDADKFALYGKNLGLAFQIIDDVLDIVQDAQKLGKPALNDFKEGKTTLPYIYLYETLDEEGRERLLSLYKKDLSQKDVKWIKESMQKSGSIERSIDRAKELGYEALKAIEDQNRDSLKGIIKDMIERDF
ncbi:MAG: polyprenyl synthetase family protein [Epsilonproteobacteria bacterium]|nr:polyprenyl synthetase family protein [Campylobacterota bacterium]